MPSSAFQSASRPSLIRQFRHVAGVELGLFLRYPKQLLAALVVVVIPAIYLLIYLSSVWDPAARTGALPVGLVNQDQGVSYRDQSLNIGRDLMDKLRQNNHFGYQEAANEDEARQLVRRGQLAFALIIPADFSANAVPGLQAGRGRLVVYTSAGNNFESSVLASQFAKALGEDVNRTLNERRWSLVLSASAGSQQNVDRLRQGLAQLRNGANELAQGVAKAESGNGVVRQGALRLQEGVLRLTEGTHQLGVGVRAMEAGLPPVEEVRALRLGAEALATGHQDFGKGLLTLRAGSQRLVQGVEAFKTEADQSLFVLASVSDGLDKLRQGAEQLEQGLGQAQGGQQQLSQGATQLSGQMGALARGVRDLRAGLRGTTAKLPDDSQLDLLRNGSAELTRATAQLQEGLVRLREGALHLNAGMELLLRELPRSVGAIEGSAEGLAYSVTPVLEVEAEVPNHGSGFAPNVIPAALWLGAGIAAFLVHVRQLPRSARDFARPALFLGKVLVPALVSLLQAALVLVTVRWVLGIAVRHPLALVVTLACASLAFVFIVFALTRAFGDAGKALAMLFLALQFSASGGLLPVELSGSLYAQISPWLPMTWVVLGVKASMFGAFEGNWQTPLAVIAGVALVAALVACWVGRWRFVPARDMHPAMDL